MKMIFEFRSVMVALAFFFSCNPYGSVDSYAGDAHTGEPAKLTAPTTPFSEVKTTIDQLVDAVTRFPGEEMLTERRKRMREVITPRFDFEEMAKRSLGTHWKEVTPAEQEEFVSVFSGLLAKTYLARIENIRQDTVKIDSENVNFPTAVVKTTVTYKGDSFPIDYKLLNRSDNWKVYDVVIENIGLVANYRNEFSGIIRKEEFVGLMKRLREKSTS